MKKAFIGGLIVTEAEVLENHVLIFSEKIESIIPRAEFKEKSVVQVIDLKGRYISPGFIDIHIHGSGGWDTMDGTEEALQGISNAVVQNGVTSILLTTMTEELEKIENALKNIRDFRKIQSQGAKILGAHFEGPYISQKFKGAQNESFIKSPDYLFIKKYGDVIKVVTLAPEIEGGFEFIEKMKAHPEIILSLGHSGATYKQCAQAYTEGVHHITHCFNGMAPMHHREPGAVGAALTKGFTCELICDNIHVSTDLYQGFVDIKGKEKTILITDSMKAGNLGDGEYSLGGQTVYVKEGSARLIDGTLAGSVLTMNKALENMFKYAQLRMEEVVYMATLAPAKVVGIEKTKGSIAVGKDSDFCVHDRVFRVYETFIQGERIFRSEDSCK